jgi:hypothetical protein
VRSVFGIWRLSLCLNSFQTFLHFLQRITGMGKNWCTLKQIFFKTEFVNSDERNVLTNDDTLINSNLIAEPTVHTA